MPVISMHVIWRHSKRKLKGNNFDVDLLFLDHSSSIVYYFMHTKIMYNVVAYTDHNDASSSYLLKFDCGRDIVLQSK